jgi:predicted RNase H-like HicB family nuclease
MTIAEVERNIKEAVALHLDGLREDCLPVPAPSTVVEYLELA